jgi:NADH-quinone oxidoreductase subunit M
MSNLLMITVLTPLIGAVVIAIVAAAKADLAKWIALGVTILTLLMAICLTQGFLNATPGAGSFAEIDRAWMPESAGVDVRFHLALDGISLWLFALSALLLV